MAHGQVTKVRSGAEKESDPNMFKCCLLPLLCSLSNLLTLQPSILRSALSSVEAGKCFGVIQPLSWRAALPVCLFYNTVWGIIKVSTIQIITATRQLKSVKAEINFFYKLFPQYTMTLKKSLGQKDVLKVIVFLLIGSHLLDHLLPTCLDSRSHLKTSFDSVILALLSWQWQKYF